MADVIISSLLVDGTPVPRKVARLHLICDILHNSAASVPSAWKYRQEFQARLGIVFDHFATIYHSFPGRITADLFKKQITTVVDIWEDWIVFSPEFTLELRERLEGAVVPHEEAVEEKSAAKPDATDAFTSRFKTSFKSSSFQPAPSVPDAKTDGGSSAQVSDGEPMDVSDDDDNAGKAGDDLDGSPVEDEDVDGAPIDDMDGVPVDDVDGVPIDDINGEPVDGGTSGADDLDGEPMGDDIDGAPVDDDLDGEPIH